MQFIDTAVPVLPPRAPLSDRKTNLPQHDRRIHLLNNRSAHFPRHRRPRHRQKSSRNPLPPGAAAEPPRKDGEEGFGAGDRGGDDADLACEQGHYLELDSGGSRVCVAENACVEGFEAAGARDDEEEAEPKSDDYFCFCRGRHLDVPD